MKFLKDESGMTRVHVTLVIISVLIIVAMAIFLIIDENGIQLELETKNETTLNEENTEQTINEDNNMEDNT